ncbi:MAG: hypothetical protein PHG03_04645 [Bacilli bacterium]|nr:hypothetical protein [Bacilli bacterium]
MKEEKEITVKVNCSYEKLHSDLISKGFNIVEEYQVNDIYMLDKNININNIPVRELLKKCILIRDIVGITKKLVYKYKETNDLGEITRQTKYECAIEDINDAEMFMKQIGYKDLIKIDDKCIVYSNNEMVLVVQVVNNHHLFIEMEDTSVHIDKIYTEISAMKKDLIDLDLDCDYTDMFVRKAEIVFNEI